MRTKYQDYDFQVLEHLSGWGLGGILHGAIMDAVGRLYRMCILGVFLLRAVN